MLINRGFGAKRLPFPQTKGESRGVGSEFDVELLAKMIDGGRVGLWVRGLKFAEKLPFGLGGLHRVVGPTPVGPIFTLLHFYPKFL